MAMKAMALVGLDVHARQTHAAVLAPDTGEVRVCKLRMAPAEVVGFLEGLGTVRAVDEAGPTGFGRPRAGGAGGGRAGGGRGGGVGVGGGAPGSIPEGFRGSREDRPPRRDPPGAAAGRGSL